MSDHGDVPPSRAITAEDFDPDKLRRQASGLMKDMKQSVARLKQFDLYAASSDEDRSAEDRKRMRKSRQRNFANKMDLIDPNYNKKAVGVVAAGVTLGVVVGATVVDGYLQATSGIGMAAAPAVMGAVVGGGFAKMEADAHAAVGDHAVLDGLLDDTGDAHRDQPADIIRNGKGPYDPNNPRSNFEEEDYNDEDENSDYLYSSSDEEYSDEESGEEMPIRRRPAAKPKESALPSPNTGQKTTVDDLGLLLSTSISKQDPKSSGNLIDMFDGLTVDSAASQPPPPASSPWSSNPTPSSATVIPEPEPFAAFEDDPFAALRSPGGRGAGYGASLSSENSSIPDGSKFSSTGHDGRPSQSFNTKSVQPEPTNTGDEFFSAFSSPARSTSSANSAPPATAPSQGSRDPFDAMWGSGLGSGSQPQQGSSKQSTSTAATIASINDPFAELDMVSSSRTQPALKTAPPTSAHSSTSNSFGVNAFAQTPASNSHSSFGSTQSSSQSTAYASAAAPSSAGGAANYSSGNENVFAAPSSGSSNPQAHNNDSFGSFNNDPFAALSQPSRTSQPLSNQSFDAFSGI